MLIMRRLHKILIMIFCFGVLVCGLGIGVMLMEFSGLQYGGELLIGSNNMTTETIDVKFETENGEKTISQRYYPSAEKYHGVQADSSVPKDTVRFQITYNEDVIEPYAYWDEDEEKVLCSWYWCGHDDELALMMEAKDVILQNLKEGKLVSINRLTIEEISEFVNPADINDERYLY